MRNLPDGPDVLGIRTRLGLTQEDFARQFGLRKSAVREWERGRRRPDMAARTLLAVISHSPDVVRAAVAADRLG